jgi:formylglycine-generating enzyme required for sulfatase activity
VGIPAPGSSGRWGLPSRASIGQTVDSPLAAPVVTDDANVPVREDGVSIEPEDAGAPPIAPPRRAGLIGVAVAGGLLVGAAMVMLLRGMVDSPSPTQSTTKIAPPAPTAPVGALLEIAGGTYDLGCNPTDKSDCDKSTMPSRSVVLSAYKIDRTEVTVARYRECVKDDDCTVDGLTDDPLLCNWTDQSRNDHPVNCVSWSQAQAYCEWAGGSLPTEAQWEHAARDKERRRFPWGDEPATCRHAVLADDQGDGCGREQTWHVGSKPQGASRSQALDMAGNVREWVADWWSPRVAPDLGRNPPGPKWGTDRVVRGGGWRDEPDALRTYHRSYMNPDVRSPDLGFRCVRKVER